MSTLSYALRDSATMLRRDVRHSLRRLSITLSGGLLVPIIMLVLFVYVFGGAIGAGQGLVAHGGAYIDYIAPGIIIMTVGSGGATTAINLCMDMSEGIIARFAALGVIALFTFALTWMSVAFGLVGKTPAGANSLSLIFQLLSFTSSAFVRPDSMSGGVRWFASYQPFTPVIDTLRGLLLGTPIGNSAVLAVAWCVGLTLIGYLWARAVYNRNSAR